MYKPFGCVVIMELTKTKHLTIAILMFWLFLTPAMVGLADFATNTIAPNNFELAAPSINSPPDLTFENGSLGEKIVWNATSNEPLNYSVSRDGEIIDSGNWDGSEIVVELDHLYEENLTYSLPVSFEFTCVVFDKQNESVSDTVMVTVIADETNPIITIEVDGIVLEEPANYTYEVGSFGHEIIWMINETNPDFYNITRLSDYPSNNFTVIESGNWAGGNISIGIDGLNATHSYLYTLFVNDTLGHNSTSTVNVTVSEDLTDPVVDSPDDISYEFGAGPYVLKWHVYDSNPKNYSIRVIVHFNDTEYGPPGQAHPPANISQPDWSFDDPKGQDIQINVTNLYLGNYTFTIILFDEYDHNSTDSVNITVYEDIRAPVVNATDEITYEEGYTGYEINWTIDESNPKTYNLTRYDGLNITIIMNGTWSGQNFVVSVDGLAVGTYIYNMTLIDYFNQTTIFITTVEVTPDAHLPTISQVRVLQSFTTVSTNNLTVQAYVWDRNNISSITIEWYTNDPENPNSKNMTLQFDNIYNAELGEFVNGETVFFRLRAVDNSSVKNEHVTQWFNYTISSQLPERTPPLLIAGAAILGGLSSIAIAVIYFKTRTRSR